MKMRMNDVKSATRTKMAEIKTTAKKMTDIYKVICKVLDEDLYENVYAFEEAFAAGDIQICDDGIIIWY
jgi:hypothetical protein